MIAPLDNKELAQEIVNRYLDKKPSDMTVREQLALHRVIHEHLPHLLFTPQHEDFKLLLGGQVSPSA